jgi:hypothetical protein
MKALTILVAVLLPQVVMLSRNVHLIPTAAQGTGTGLPVTPPGN